MMVMLSIVVLLLIIFFKTPYKRLDAETSSSNHNLSSSSSSHSLTATSGYSSEITSRNTNSHPKDGGKEAKGDESDVEQCRL